MDEGWKASHFLFIIAIIILIIAVILCFHVGNTCNDNPQPNERPFLDIQRVNWLFYGALILAVFAIILQIYEAKRGVKQYVTGM